jgi:hypothetical protein
MRAEAAPTKPGARGVFGSRQDRHDCQSIPPAFYSGIACGISFIPRGPSDVVTFGSRQAKASLARSWPPHECSRQRQITFLIFLS